MMQALTRLLEPFNTHATSVGGAGLVSAAVIALARDVTDPSWLAATYLAITRHGSIAPLAQLAAIGFGFVLGAAALYIGAPWFVGSTRLMPLEPQEKSIPFKPAA
jgi:hypothetical protein